MPNNETVKARPLSSSAAKPTKPRKAKSATPKPDAATAAVKLAAFTYGNAEARAALGYPGKSASPADRDNWFADLEIAALAKCRRQVKYDRTVDGETVTLTCSPRHFVRVVIRGLGDSASTRKNAALSVRVA